MLRPICSFLAIFILSACAGPEPSVPAAASAIERKDLNRYFAEAGTDGTMVVLDPRSGSSVVVNASRASVEHLPSSTFKIPNTLIALETGVAKDVDGEIFSSDGTVFELDGKPLLAAKCESDITLRVAFQLSCIPAFQQVARRVGRTGYAKWLAAFDYGNRDIGGAPVDAFWLTGKLRTNAWQQVTFLAKLAEGRLPVSRRTLDMVRGIMVVETGDGIVLRAKTGYAYAESPRVGWWVGWAEKDGQTRVFALNLEMTAPGHAKARIEIGKAILRELGAI
jgi:beta-lactamase class D